MSAEWEKMESAPRDGTIIEVRYKDGVLGHCRWLTAAKGQKDTKAMRDRVKLIEKHGGYWSHVRLTRPSQTPWFWRDYAAQPKE